MLQKEGLPMTYSVEKAAAELMLEHEDLIEILYFFFGEADKILSQCEKAVEESDFAVLRQLFHSLKGTTANFRMDSLNQMAVTLEKAAQTDNLDLVKGMLPDFTRELNSVREQVERYSG